MLDAKVKPDKEVEDETPVEKIEKPHKKKKPEIKKAKVGKEKVKMEKVKLDKTSITKDQGEIGEQPEEKYEFLILF